MGGFKIYQDNYADFTVVSNKFIDEYMEDANDAQLKIYLYLMRMVNAALPTGISDIADRFNYTEKDVMRALQYWAKKHLLELEYDHNQVLVGVRMLPLCGDSRSNAGSVPNAQAQNDHAQNGRAQNVSAQNIPAQNIQTQNAPMASASQTVAPTQGSPVASGSAVVAPSFSAPAAPVITSMSIVKPQYSKEDLIHFKTDATTSQLVFIAEQYLHKTLSVSELSTLFYISDTLRFSDDLIDYLLQYCVGREKTDYRYIEAVALDWAQSGITTAKQAASHARKYDRIVYEIMNALGKTSAPTTTEIAYITKWTHDFAYDMAVISIACERTVLNTDKRRFNYADSILTRWHEMGIRHKADVDAMDPPKKVVPGTGGNGSGAGKNKFNQFPQNSYDFDALEKALVNK